MKALLVLAVILVQSSQPIAIAQSPKTKLTVSADCTDSIGELFIYHLREEIRNSAGYSLDDNSNITLSLVCLDNSLGGSGLGTVASLVITGRYTVKECTFTLIIGQQVLKIGRESTHVMASRVLASLDNTLHK